jgi:NADH-quinone oxidoreductase subunit E
MTDSFCFTPDNAETARVILSRYPANRKQSALLPFLDLAQRQNGGWLSPPVLRFLSETLEVPEIKVYEVASFYTMFNLKPVGRYHLQFCRTTPCWLRGAETLENAVFTHLNARIGETTPDGLFTLSRVECLGACVNAPVLQVNDDFYEDLTETTVITLLDDLAQGRQPTVGTQVKRQTSAPLVGRCTLVS